MPNEYKASTFREMTSDEVRQTLRDMSEELFNLRFRNSMKQLDNPLRVREVRRAMARLKTILRERGEQEHHVEKVKRDEDKS